MISHSDNNKSGSKERLEKISHHFFSHSKEAVKGARPATYIPILLESEKQDAFVFAMNNHFSLKNHLSAVVNVDSALRESLPLEKKSVLELTCEAETNRSRIIEHLKELNVSPELCLLPFVSHEVSILSDGDFLLTVVPASLTGVRRVFHRLEKVCQGMKGLKIGIVVVDANSLQMSQLCYDVMENSIDSFLGLKSVVLGHLLSNTAVDLAKGRFIQFPDEIDKLGSAPIELEDIADNILNKLSKLVAQRPAMNILTQVNDRNVKANRDFNSLSA